MQIKKIEICGFKSFVDKTELLFNHPVTGIVGPNGCGKSNIVDAIRWAMGEQSARHLRGKAMEDVIFNGSEGRGPSGFAEVTVSFDNLDGIAPPEYRDYAEIAVTRRLDREGNSDYLINRVPVRLMDVTSLFMGTGVGKRAYSIIEQGRIGFIVSSKPEDRRHLIEEAAGVTKFKARKRAAERKMDQTRQNLVRISDIIQEIERNLASLKRQAQKAERYKRYRAEMRDLELHVASHRWLELTGNQKVLSSALEAATSAVDGQRLALRVKEAELESERVDLSRVERQVDGAQTRAYELDNAVRLLESQITHHLERLQALRDSELQMEREIGEVEGQRGALSGERDMLAASLSDLEAREREAQAVLANELEELDRRRVASGEAEGSVAGARSGVSEAETRIARAEAVIHGIGQRREERRERLDRLVAEREACGRREAEAREEAAAFAARLGGLRSGSQETAARRGELEAELETLRQRIRESDPHLESLREQLASKRSRLRSLEEIQQRFEGVHAGVRALMGRFSGDEAAQAGAGVAGLLADRLECPAELTSALAGALGEQLQYVVVDDLGAGLSALDYLRREEKGRATVVPRTPRRVIQPSPVVPDEPGVLGCLADLVSHAPVDLALVRHLLGEVIVVESLEVAVSLHERGVVDGTLVTLAGDVLGRDGTMTGGAGDEAGAHLLQLKREIRELSEAVAGLERDLERTVAEHRELRTGIATRQAAMDGARSEAHDAEISIVKADRDLATAREEVERVQRRASDLESEAAELRRLVEQSNEEERRARVEIHSAQEDRAEAERALASAEEVHRERREAVDAQSMRVTEVRVRAAQARERAEGDRSAMDRLLRSIEELDGRGERLAGDLAAGARQQGQLMAEVLMARESLSETVGQAMDAHEALAVVRSRFEDARQALGEREGDLKVLRTRIEEATQEASDLTLREREIALALEHLLDQIAERHRVDLRRVLGDFHARDIPDESIRGRIDELIRLIERMGEINLTAIEEYEEKAARYEYLTTQRADLESALTQLERAIRQMNRESRRLFRDAFEAVNERFKKVFPTMFGGGKGELRLTDPEDLLESGVDIVAQPPGKRLGSLELMSGGEKALTAVSLIFAIFQFRPSPFCLLDEVDAPLDEANIGRFSDAIRQMTDRSQFILITHAKRTMESTDVLYGVTMEVPGVSKMVAVELRGDDGRRPAAGDDATSASSSQAVAVA